MFRKLRHWIENYKFIYRGCAKGGLHLTFMSHQERQSFKDIENPREMIEIFTSQYFDKSIVVNPQRNLAYLVMKLENGIQFTRITADDLIELLNGSFAEAVDQAE